jgi:hypothetical protein
LLVTGSYILGRRRACLGEESLEENGKLLEKLLDKFAAFLGTDVLIIFFTARKLSGSICSKDVKLASAKLLPISFSPNNDTPFSAMRKRTISSLWCSMAIAKGERPLEVKIGPSLLFLPFLGGDRNGMNRSDFSHWTSFSLPPRIETWMGYIE